MDWEAPPKPAELAESRLISAILDGYFPIGDTLPAERELAAQLGITRPTLREVLQRMARDGWIEIRHGHSTRVRDYWREGNLGVLGAIARNPQHVPEDFIPNLLFIRLLMAPVYTRMAIERVPELVLELLRNSPSVENNSFTLANFDWRLHYQLTLFSGNPVFTLILNGFKELYLPMALIYFDAAETRAHSLAFYRSLFEAAVNGDLEQAERLTKHIMEESLHLWRKVSVERK